MSVRNLSLSPTQFSIRLFDNNRGVHTPRYDMPSLRDLMHRPKIQSNENLLLPDCAAYFALHNDPFVFPKQLDRHHQHGMEHRQQLVGRCARRQRHRLHPQRVEQPDDKHVERCRQIGGY